MFVDTKAPGEIQGQKITTLSAAIREGLRRPDAVETKKAYLVHGPFPTTEDFPDAKIYVCAVGLIALGLGYSSADRYPLPSTIFKHIYEALPGIPERLLVEISHRHCMPGATALQVADWLEVKGL